MPTFTDHPIFAYDNFLDSVYANPSVALGTIDGTSEQIFSLASGRRTRNPTPWQPGSAIDQKITVDIGSSKQANFVWLDKGHNYAGEGITLQHSTTLGGAYTDLFTNKIVGTDGKDMDDGSWLFLFEGTLQNKQFWRINFENVSTVTINIPGLWFGVASELSSYFDTVDELSSRVHRPNVQVSDRGITSSDTAQRRIYEFMVAIERLQANELTNIMEPLMDHLALGGLTLAVIDWPDNGEATRLYQLASDRVGAPFHVRGSEKVGFQLAEVV